MKITRINKDRRVEKETDILSFSHDGESYTITPEMRGFRVHKHSLDDGLRIEPSCNNEIIIR